MNKSLTTDGNNAMKVELKRLKVHARLSQETTAFAADVWIYGKKAGYADNAGHGGATREVNLHTYEHTPTGAVPRHLIARIIP